MSGLFIAFEGVEGAGKTTQAGLLESALLKRGYRPSLLREPGSTRLGEYLREYLINGAPLSPTAELLLFEAARAQLMTEKVAGEPDTGAVIIADRFAGSTVAYQGYGRGIDLERINWLNDFATGGRYPDLTLLLDVDPAVGLGRVKGRQLSLGMLDDDGFDRFEDADIAFHDKVRRGFLDLEDKTASWRFIPGNHPIEYVAAQVWDAVCGLLPES